MTDLQIVETSQAADPCTQNVLEKVSPSLWSRLVHRFDAPSLEILSTAYAESCRNGALEEGFQRAPGASFNPRPARIATLLIDGLPTIEPEDLLVAFACSQTRSSCEKLNEVTANDQIEPYRMRGTSEQTNVIRAVSLGISDRRLNGISEIVAGVLILDLLRHHHLMPHPPAVDYVYEFLRVATPSFKELRLYLLIDTALDRCLRRLSRKTA
jgi:hypothetical protein